MPKYFCDFCDVFLTHDSPAVRKAHNAGRNHLQNVKDYYSSLGHDKMQTWIDDLCKAVEKGQPVPLPPPGVLGLNAPAMLPPPPPMFLPIPGSMGPPMGMPMPGMMGMGMPMR